VQLAERFRALHDPMQARRHKLRDALRLQQFYRDVEDEEDWIREKEPIAASANRGWYIAVFVGELGLTSCCFYGLTVSACLCICAG